MLALHWLRISAIGDHAKSSCSIRSSRLLGAGCISLPAMWSSSCWISGAAFRFTISAAKERMCICHELSSSVITGASTAIGAIRL